jgi:hypothetical protein
LRGTASAKGISLSLRHGVNPLAALGSDPSHNAAEA